MCSNLRMNSSNILIVWFHHGGRSKGNGCLEHKCILYTRMSNLKLSIHYVIRTGNRGVMYSPLLAIHKVEGTKKLLNCEQP